MNLRLLSTVQEKREELAVLLTNCVESGASVGFVPPLPMSQALQYWDGLAPGLHRAEVEKLMVHTGHRRGGLGRALMDGIEQLARKYNRKLLVLDTRSGDAASALYRKCGYIEAGQIPGYALNATGQLDATTYFYKQL